MRSRGALEAPHKAIIVSQSILHDLEISEELVGLRLDQALAIKFPQYSRSQIKTWIDAGQVHLNGTVRRPKHPVVLKDQVEMTATLDASADIEPQAVDFSVVYSDEDLIVVDKPAGCVVHPGAGNKDGTLANGLIHRYAELESLPRAGLVHRLDKETSGLLLVARNHNSYQLLTSMMANRDISRSYIALCNGIIISGGTIDEPIGRDPNNRLKMKIKRDGRKAISHYRVTEKYRSHTLCEVTLETGRTHQIRVHMTHLGHPIVGDKRYGGRLVLPSKPLDEFRDALSQLDRHVLHAKALAFVHPVTGEQISTQSPTPQTLTRILQLAKQDQLYGAAERS